LGFDTGYKGFDSDQMRRSLSDLETKRRMDSPFYRGFRTREISLGSTREIGDKLEDGELWDFNGKLYSSDGTLPRVIPALGQYPSYDFRGEDSPGFQAKAGFGGALMIHYSISNLLSSLDYLEGADWTSNNTTEASSYYIYDNHEFAQISLTAASGYLSQAITCTNQNRCAIQGVFKRGDETSITYLIFRDTTVGANRIDLRIDWSTDAVTANQGVLLEETWLDDDTVFITGRGSIAGTWSNNHEVRVQGTTNGKYFYATAIQAQSYYYPQLFTDNSRRYNGVSYYHVFPVQGSIEFWVKPCFPYDMPDNQYFFDTNKIDFEYNPTTDTIDFRVVGGTNTVTLTSSTYTSNSDLMKWIHVKGVWDQPNDNYYLYIDGELVDSDTATDIGTWGCDPYFNLANVDFLICDLRITDYVDRSTAHAIRGVPWIDLREMTSQGQAISISPYGATIRGGQVKVETLEPDVTFVGNAKIYYDNPGTLIITER